jgi:hypothetical protein
VTPFVLPRLFKLRLCDLLLGWRGLLCFVNFGALAVDWTKSHLSQQLTGMAAQGILFPSPDHSLPTSGMYAVI